MGDDEKRKRGTPWLAMWGLFLLLAYPLSLGPLNWLEQRGFLDRLPDWLLAVISVLYIPLGWLCQIHWCNELLYWYVNLWVD